MSRDQSLLERFRAIRNTTLLLTRPLTPEDMVVQSMPDASPTKWHLAHTSWFFEEFVLGRQVPGYQPFHPSFRYLFNSYYDAVGERHPRPQRGVLSRPSVEEILAYRRHVDEAMSRLLERADRLDPDAAGVVELGLNHEQQHQELLLTDLKHAFSLNALHPQYAAPTGDEVRARSKSLAWISHAGGLVEVGHDGSGFSFDNEAPRHRVFLEPFELASRLVTVGEYLAFIDDDGYHRPELWLSEGWDVLSREHWTHPLYWHPHDDGFVQFTLSGLRALDPAEPVCHVSYYEADAYARWADARLPTEQEWETIAAKAAPDAARDNLQERRRFHPMPPSADGHQLYGDAWEWTQSPYVAYPGYKPAAGALGEYNGKFMCNQFVLRGGSCVTPASHLRATYRNFFPAHARWQFSGIRLARDVSRT